LSSMVCNPKIYRPTVFYKIIHFKNLGKNILLKNENAKETKLAAKTLYCMSTTLFLAKKMGEGMG